MSVIKFPVERCRPSGAAKGRLGHNGLPIDWSAVAAAEKRLAELLAKHPRHAAMSRRFAELQLGDNAPSSTRTFFQEYWPGVF